MRSSTEHCVSAPAARHLRADQQRERVGRRVAEHGHRRLELAEAERHGAAASAAISSGWSTRFVTWAWIDGVRRTRILDIAESSSTATAATQHSAMRAARHAAPSRP
jgi:hypothetical protein